MKEEIQLFVWKEALNLVENFTTINDLPKFNKIRSEKINPEFFSEEIKIENLNYYLSNSVSRSSKTMSECHQARQKTNKTGTNN